MPKKLRRSQEWTPAGVIHWVRSYAQWFIAGFVTFIVLTVIVLIMLLIGMWKLIARPVAVGLSDDKTTQEIVQDQQKIKNLEEKVQKLEQQMQSLPKSK